jgi:hypothetical protein
MKNEPKLVSQKRGFRVKPVKNGRYKFVVFRYRNGKMADSQFFHGLNPANEHARRQNIQLRNEGAQAGNLDLALRAMALEGQEALAPYGKTIRDAVSFYLEHLEKLQGLKKVALEDLVSAYHNSKKPNKTRPASDRYLASLRHHLNLLVDKLGADMAPADVTQTDIVSVIDSRKDIEATTWNNYKADYSVFFEYALKHKYVTSNPVGEIEDLPEGDRKIEVLKPDEMKRLLDAASDRMKPVLALQGFAGVRREEIQKLPWEEIRFDTSSLIVP